jgi:hypothetical protein
MLYTTYRRTRREIWHRTSHSGCLLFGLFCLHPQSRKHILTNGLLFEDPSDDNRKGQSNYWIFEECREPTVFERVRHPNLSGTTVMLSCGTGMYRGTQFDSLSAGDTIRVGRLRYGGL